jgi:hypothetical protein
MPNPTAPVGAEDTSWWQQIMRALFPAEQGGMAFPAGTEAMMAAQKQEREAARLKAEQAALPAADGKGPGAKRKLTPEEEALQNLLNSPRGQNFGR